MVTTKTSYAASTWKSTKSTRSSRTEDQLSSTAVVKINSTRKGVCYFISKRILLNSISLRLAQRLSQTSIQATFSNVNPMQSLPYASPISTQLGKQSTATPRHPRCTLHLDGNFIFFSK